MTVTLSKYLLIFAKHQRPLSFREANELSGPQVEEYNRLVRRAYNEKIGFRGRDENNSQI